MQNYNLCDIRNNIGNAYATVVYEREELMCECNCMWEWRWTAKANATVNYAWITDVNAWLWLCVWMHLCLHIHIFADTVCKMCNYFPITKMGATVTGHHISQFCLLVLLPTHFQCWLRLFTMKTTLSRLKVHYWLTNLLFSNTYLVKWSPLLTMIPALCHSE